MRAFESRVLTRAVRVLAPLVGGLLLASAHALLRLRRAGAAALLRLTPRALSGSRLRLWTPRAPVRELRTRDARLDVGRQDRPQSITSSRLESAQARAAHVRRVRVLVDEIDDFAQQAEYLDVDRIPFQVIKVRRK